MKLKFIIVYYWIKKKKKKTHAILFSFDNIFLSILAIFNFQIISKDFISSEQYFTKIWSYYPIYTTPGPRYRPDRIGSGSGTGPLDYESRDPVPDPETLPFHDSISHRSQWAIKLSGRD